jgi:hypothetical protein
MTPQLEILLTGWVKAREARRAAMMGLFDTATEINSLDALDKIRLELEPLSDQEEAATTALHNYIKNNFQVTA